MSEAKVIFSLDGDDLTIECSTDDKMRDICQKFASKIDKNIDSLIFLYGGVQVNFGLSFKEQANSLDNNQMKVLVHKNKDEEYNNLNNKILIENITSVYFLQKIFSYMDEKVKLKAIRYNKKLQKKNDISLINYKIFSFRYIIYETKIKGKEYNGFNDNLLFEGEYLNGERHGKGAEYNNKGKLIFEGEYLNGKRWNGKGYDRNNNIVYELKEGRSYNRI